MDERNFLKIVVGGAAAAVLIILLTAFAVYYNNQRKLQKIVSNAELAIKLSQQQSKSNQWDDAIKTATEAQKEFLASGYAHKLQPIQRKLVID